jgi:threonine/homoserine/homoserine lactone efflux protein
MPDPILFTLVVLAVLGMPGPTNTLLATAGATGGVRRSLVLIPAESAGYLVTITTLGMVVGPAVTASPWLATVLRCAVGAYLVVLAARLWRHGGVSLAPGAAVTPTNLFVTTLLNPKGIVFALAIVPFGAPSVWRYMLGFLVMAVSAAICWVAAGAVLGGLANMRGWAGFVPRVSAITLTTFVGLLVVMPLFR